MRVLTLNLRHGGGERVDALAEHVRAAEPDLAVLTEYRATGPSQRVVSSLAHEFPFVHRNPAPDTSRNGVAVLSRYELRPEPVTGVIAGEEHRWVEVVLPAMGLRLVGLYVPGSGSTVESRALKTKFWAALVAAAPDLADGRTVVIGDLNTGLRLIDETSATFRCADQFAAFGETLVDAWRATRGVGAREFSWYSSVGNGFRIDHAFVSPQLAPFVVDCRYDHAPRRAGSTDHSMLVLDIDMPASGPGS